MDMCESYHGNVEDKVQSRWSERVPRFVMPAESGHAVLEPFAKSFEVEDVICTR